MINKSEITPGIKFIAALIGIAAISRLLPHPMNFSPIGAIALFAGTFISNKKMAFALPLITLLISDILLQLVNGTGFYRDMFFVYGSFAFVVGIGFMLRSNTQRQTIMVASLVGSIVFFFITNFGSWLMYEMYPKNAQGLISCYVAGIPFFRGTLMGDLFYNLLLFGSFALAKWRYPVLAKS